MHIRDRSVTMAGDFVAGVQSERRKFKMSCFYDALKRWKSSITLYASDWTGVSIDGFQQIARSAIMKEECSLTDTQLPVIGYELLRLAEPDQMPCMLLWE